MSVRQDCVVSPWLFNMYREVYARDEGNGVNLVGLDGSRFGFSL